MPDLLWDFGNKSIVRRQKWPCISTCNRVQFTPNLHPLHDVLHLFPPPHSPAGQRLLPPVVECCELTSAGGGAAGRRRRGRGVGRRLRSSSACWYDRRRRTLAANFYYICVNFYVSRIWLFQSYMIIMIFFLNLLNMLDDLCVRWLVFVALSYTAIAHCLCIIRFKVKINKDWIGMNVI